jgi:hypothetical protein
MLRIRPVNKTFDRLPGCLRPCCAVARGRNETRLFMSYFYELPVAKVECLSAKDLTESTGEFEAKLVILTTDILRRTK